MEGWARFVMGVDAEVVPLFADGAAKE